MTAALLAFRGIADGMPNVLLAIVIVMLGLLAITAGKGPKWPR